ncbi:hypothetical protein ASPVEDRAFT_36064 [Aspergillus versicolor CBS 583.65]|uniref:Secreted protein n=1 Tax=Aspergillus versicolor CBS 583.65 TaxID=1036611 RepID=A0A1L9P586_ASPVE|nr:uncharacterized protein ASPVEDRAFT_36064 [Aspergillus versicolor CBS 583.65]OJI96662.1 hypothetical protein ASPVEDRAFT_36064 [Aspergillus versicolor CBS 583.65]
MQEMQPHLKVTTCHVFFFLTLLSGPISSSRDGDLLVFGLAACLLRDSKRRVRVPPGEASELESAWSSGLRDLPTDRATTKIIRDKQPNPPRMQKYQRASIEVHVGGLLTLSREEASNCVLCPVEV